MSKSNQFTTDELHRIKEDTIVRVNNALKAAAEAPDEEKESKLVELETLRAQARKVDLLLAGPKPRAKSASGASEGGKPPAAKKGLPQRSSPQPSA